MRKIYIPLLLLFIIACDPGAKLSIDDPTVEYIYENPKDDFFPDMRFGPVSDTVYLDAMIDDCGEWGGPKDRFALY